MADEIEDTPAPFVPVPCSLGTWTGVDGDAYLITQADGQVISILANDTPSAEAIEADIASPASPPVDQATVWAAMLAGNITDPVTSIPLRASIATRDILTATLVMLREAETAGQINGDTPQTIWDADNVERTLTVNELRGLILRYGFAWQQMHATYAP